MSQRGKSETLFVSVRAVGDRFVECGPDATVVDLLAALELPEQADDRSIHVERTGQLLSPDQLLSSADIRSGDALRIVEIDRRLSFPRRPETTEPTPSVTLPSATLPSATLQMLSGPRAGSLYSLGPGSSTVGRVSTNDVVIVDPGISRHHAVINVEASSVTLIDNQSTNGVRVDGELITGPVTIVSGQQLMLGHSWVSIVHHPPFDPTVDSREVRFEPSTRTVHRFLEETYLLPSPPDPGAKRRRSDLLSPGRSYKQSVEQFLEALEAAEGRLRTRLEHQVASRLYEAPSIHEVLAGVPSKIRLWERQGFDPDALEVRIGLGSRPSRTSIQVPVGGAAEMRAALAAVPERHSTVDNVPIVVDVGEVGSISLRGQIDSVAALAYSLVAQLAWFHGPEHLGLAYRPGERSEGWDWLKWLPHLDFAGSHNGVAGTDFVGWVSALLDGASPSIATNGGVDERRVRPNAIVIILDNETSLPTALLARLVQEGPAIGVYSLLLSGELADLGVTVGAAITVGADSADLDLGSGEHIAGIPLEVIDHETVSAFARQLTPIRCPKSSSGIKMGVSDGQVSGAGVTVGPFTLGMAQPLAAAHSTAPAIPTMPQRAPSAPRQRDLNTMPHGDDDGRLVLGTVEVAGRRSPAVFACNLARDGSMCLTGERGSGKTSALRSIAAAAAMLQVEPAMVPLTYFLDVRGELEGVGVLPHCTGAARNDIDGFRSVVTDLERLMADRVAALAQADVGSFDEYRSIAPQSALRRVLVLVDEVDAFIQLMDSLEPGRGGVLLQRLVEQGGLLGMHLVFTAARRDELPSELVRYVGRWLRLGGADPEVGMRPGTAAIGKNEVQFATVGGGRAPHRALAELSSQLVERGVAPVGL